MPLPESDADAYERARRRVQELRALYTHVILFAALSVVQFAIDWLQDRSGERSIDWAYWSLFGWGIGVAVHAWSVLGQSLGQEWERRKIEELVARDRARLETLGRRASAAATARDAGGAEEGRS
ncbi:MAG: 2TM domain-containing protein [Planctomycetota bacterium]